MAKLTNSVADGLDPVELATVSGSRPVTPEVVLWAAVVEAAFCDAFESSDSKLAEGRPYRLTEESNFDPVAVRAEARRFLVSNLDPWRSSREDICDSANLDPDKIRAIARRMVEKVQAEEAAAEAEGRKPKRNNYNRRLPRRYDVRFEEHAEDIDRLAELADLDAKHRAAELSKQGQNRSRLYWERKRAEAADALAAIEVQATV